MTMAGSRGIADLIPSRLTPRVHQQSANNACIWKHVYFASFCFPQRLYVSCRRPAPGFQKTYLPFPQLRPPGRIVFLQQSGGRGRVPVVARAPFVFDLRQTVFDDAVAPTEDRAVVVDRVKARPDRTGMRVFEDELVEAFWLRGIGL